MRPDRKQKRVLFVSSYPGFAGSQRMALQLAAGHQAAGGHAIAGAPKEMAFLTKSRELGIEAWDLAVPDRLAKYEGALTDAGLAAKVSVLVRDLLPHSLQLSRRLRRAGIDAVYGATGRCVLTVGLAARLAGVPVLWHAQGGPTKGGRTLYTLAAVLATRIVCVSNSVSAEVARTVGQWALRRTSVVHNGIEQLPRDPGTDTTVEDLGDFVLFAGNVVPEKGVHHLIQAFGRLPREVLAGLSLLIAGPLREPAYATHLEGLVSDAGLETQVSFLGYRDDLPALLDRALIVACPSVERETLQLGSQSREVSWKEGFCLVALEGMRAAKPVVASRTHGLREVVAHGETGILVPPSSVEALRDALLELVSDPELAERYGQSGFERFLAKFTSERMVREFLDQLDRMLS